MYPLSLMRNKKWWLKRPIKNSLELQSMNHPSWPTWDFESECTPNNVPLIRTLQLTLKSIPTSGGRCQQQSFCQNAHSTSPPNPTQIMIVFSLGCLFPTALKYILSFLLLAFRLQLPMILETWKMKFFCFIVAPQSTTTATSAGRPYPTAHAQVEAAWHWPSRLLAFAPGWYFQVWVL